ncbi:S1 family peptidase [Pseudomonas sp. Marseille-Q5115]|uniref:S1 family peptidase n=1 Tax=Pseudomonas sp. Marseille-Q5115 TaxID=2866593 RepID=UPI001CE45E0B|nr:serine protease [Pseudomonas sp. Marseille-Q5115]
MNLKTLHLFEKLLHCVVRIEALRNGQSFSTGTGFAYNFTLDNGERFPAIVTNKHVLEGADEISIPITPCDMDGEMEKGYRNIKLSLVEDFIYRHPDDVDLLAFPAHMFFEMLRPNGQQPGFVSLDPSILATGETFKEVLPLDSLTMFGYPNGIWDKINNGAIARRGVIANLPRHDFLGKPQFVVDMACFPGSSGSPIFLLDNGSYSDRQGNINLGTRVKLLGILYAGPQHTAAGQIIVQPIPTANVPMPITGIPNNLGYAIKSTELIAIQDVIRGKNPRT